jgi:signal transduction histidine kinase
MSTPQSAPPTRLFSRLRVGQWLGLTIGVLLVLAVVSIGLALIANAHLTERRLFLLDQVGPSLRSSIELEGALVNEETGVRGYVISAQPSFLEPYRDGLRAAASAYRELHAREHATGPMIAADVEAVHARALDWRRLYVTPTLQQAGGIRRRSLQASLRGKALFDQIRGTLSRLQSVLTSKDTSTRNQLNHAANVLQAILIIAGALILGSLLGAGFLLRRIVTRPLARLGEEARQVAGGEFGKPVAITVGAREIVQLGGEIDEMRQRIVRELTTIESAHERLEAQAFELTRSNSELEQFAYVASHDLQEPLRKVASFCEALERRYRGQLDERADQYIDFAVDGAKRMQILINDLLAFSRVGRSGREHELVDLGDVLAEVETSLSGSLEEARATVVAEGLPVVRGERTLLVSLFQNLLANAVKFRGSEPPVIRLDSRRERDQWSLSCADNGIGIDPEYADRIFIIFQRLHTKEAYPGTGIGLAMCRKIVEYHHGRMWLDPGTAGGACFRFTLPIIEETE